MTAVPRRRFLIGAGSLAALAVSACVENAPGRIVEAVAQMAAEAEMPEPLTVDLWHGLGGADGRTFAELAAQYMEALPGIVVQARLLGGDAFYREVPAAIAGGRPPAMVIAHEWAIGEWGPRGVLQAGDHFYDDRGLPRDDFLPAAFANIHYAGSPLGVLLDVHGSGAYVNAELLAAADLDVGAPPADRTAFVAQMARLTRDAAGRAPGDAGFDPDAVVQHAFHAHFWARWAMLEAIWQNGGDVLDADGTRSALDAEPVRDALAFWHAMVHDLHLHAPPAGYRQTDAFRRGALAVAVAGSWWLNFIRDSGREDRTAFWRVPQYGRVQPQAWMSAHVMGIPRGADADGAAGAADFIVWLSDHGLDWARSGQPPARLSQQNAPALRNHWHTGPFAAQFQAIGRTERQHPRITAIQNAYQTAFAAVIANARTVDEGLADAHRRVQAVLDDACCARGGI